MKQKLLLSLFAVLTATIAWADVEINEENFPDGNFRGFLLEQEYGSDGVLTDAEIAGVTSINVNSKGIQSLKGIEFFTALKKLDCRENQLTALDVSKNLALESLDCLSNLLPVLDISQNTALKRLSCSINQLTSLDVSKNTALTFLSCSNNQLTELDVSLLSALDSLNCWANRFTSLDVSKNTALGYLDCGKNQLTSLDVSQNTALTQLNCWENQFTSLDVSKNTALKIMTCAGNQLTSLDVSKNTTLWRLSCYKNKIFGENMDALIESLPKLTEGYLSVLYYENEENVMTAKQVAAAKAKGWLAGYCAGLDDEGVEMWYVYQGGADVEINEENFPDGNFRGFLLEQEYGSDGVLTDAEIADVTSIVVTGKDIQSLKGIEFFTALKELDCMENQLTELDVSQNLALEHLDCRENQLTELNVSRLTALTWFACSANPLTELDVSKNTALTFLSCSNDQLTELDVSQNTALDTLNCWANLFTSLDVSKNTELDYLDCGLNQLTSIDLSNNTKLRTLYCDRNQLTALDVSNQTALVYLSCLVNQLTSLDVSHNTVLMALDCGDNQLTSLDVSENTELLALGCYKNQIYGERMDALIESMPTVTESELYVLYYEKEQNVMTTKQAAAAKAKGWQVLYCPGLDDEGNEIWEKYKVGDGIEEIKNEDSSLFTLHSSLSGWYDLSGRRVQKPGKGIYIHNGEKILK